MDRVQVYSFRVAGVTMDGRQSILKKLRRAIKKKCGGKLDNAFAKVKYNQQLARLKVRLRPEPENEHDDDAIAIDVYSGTRGWLNLGYVPAKTKLGKGKKSAKLQKILHVLIKHELVREIRISRLEFFRNDEEELIYFCFVTIEYETV